MAGYIMTLDSLESLKQCIKTGTYSTNLSEPNGSWRLHHEGTFADFLSMQPEDNIYFFIKSLSFPIFHNSLTPHKPYVLSNSHAYQVHFPCAVD